MAKPTLTEKVVANKEVVSDLFDAINDRLPDRPDAYTSSAAKEHNKIVHGRRYVLVHHVQHPISGGQVCYTMHRFDSRARAWAAPLYGTRNDDQLLLEQTGSGGNVPFAQQFEGDDAYTLSGTRGSPEGVEHPMTTCFRRMVLGGSAYELH